MEGAPLALVDDDVAVLITCLLNDFPCLRMATVSLQIVKGLNPLYGSAAPAERRELVAEFKSALSAYLKTRLHK